MLIVVLILIVLTSGVGVWYSTEPLRHKPIQSGLDEFGYRIGYDAHYTRALEVDGEVTVDTQCDDKDCRTCYWKPRHMGQGGYVGLVESRRDTFIESLPDGLTDAEYDQRLTAYNNIQKSVRLTKSSPIKTTKPPYNKNARPAGIWDERKREKEARDLAAVFRDSENKANANYVVLSDESDVPLHNDWNDAIRLGWEW